MIDMHFLKSTLLFFHSPAKSMTCWYPALISRMARAASSGVTAPAATCCMRATTFGSARGPVRASPAGGTAAAAVGAGGGGGADDTADCCGVAAAVAGGEEGRCG